MQKLIRRVRVIGPTAAGRETPRDATETQDVAKQTPAAPTRRLRMTSDRLTRLAEDRQSILEDLKLISESDAAIDRATEVKDVALARIESRMREHNMTVADNGNLIAEIKETFTRQSRTIDPKKFRNQVTNDVFWSCASISVTSAGEHLGQKEIDAISDVVPARSNGFKLSVREMKSKK